MAKTATLNLYRIETKGFDCCKDVIEPVLLVFVAAADEAEARRVAFIHAMVVAEEKLAIPECDMDEDNMDGDNAWWLEHAEESGPAYEREAFKFLDPEQSQITLIGTSVEKDAWVIHEDRMIYE